MKAIDTCVLARFILNDDPVQSPLAAHVLAQGAYISNSVWLETAWLLKSRYRLSRVEVVTAIRALLEMPDVHVSDLPQLRWAVDRVEQGADVADMIHLLDCGGYGVFATFDAGIAIHSDQAPTAIETLSA